MDRGDGCVTGPHVPQEIWRCDGCRSLGCHSWERSPQSNIYLLVVGTTAEKSLFALSSADGSHPFLSLPSDINVKNGSVSQRVKGEELKGRCVRGERLCFASPFLKKTTKKQRSNLPGKHFTSASLRMHISCHFASRAFRSFSYLPQTTIQLAPLSGDRGLT